MGTPTLLNSHPTDLPRSSSEELTPDMVNLPIVTFSIQTEDSKPTEFNNLNITLREEVKCNYLQEETTYKIWHDSQSPYCITRYTYTEWLWQHKDEKSLCTHELMLARCNYHHHEALKGHDILVEHDNVLTCFGYKYITEHGWKTVDVTSQDKDMYGPIYQYHDGSYHYRVAHWAFSKVLTYKNGAISNFDLTTDRERVIPSQKYILSSSKRIKELYLSNCLKEWKLDLKPAPHSNVRGKEILRSTPNLISHNGKNFYSNTDYIWYKFLTITKPPDKILGIKQHLSGSIPIIEEAVDDISMKIPCYKCQPLFLIEHEDNNYKQSKRNNIVMIGHSTPVGCYIDYNSDLQCTSIEDTFTLIKHHHFDLEENVSLTTSKILEDSFLWLYNKLINPIMAILAGDEWQGKVMKIMLIQALTFYITLGNMPLSILVSLLIYFIT